VSRAARLVVLGVSLCLLGGSFAVSPLYVAGVSLILVALAAEASVRLGTRRARVRLELDADTVEEGSRVTLKVRADGWPIVASRAQLCAHPGASWRPVGVGGGQLELQVSPPRRGEFVVGPAAVRFADPFAICAGERLSETARLLVLPRVERIRREDLERLRRLGRAAPRDDRGTGVGGLRPYRVGAPASRIHWLSVARRGALLERRFEEDDEEAAITIALDARSPASAEALDAAVRAAASLCVGLAGVGGCALLLPGWGSARTVRADLSAWAGLHGHLARVADGCELDGRALARARLVVLVSARRRSSHRLSAGVGVGCVVSPFALDRAVLFRVAGCAVQSATGGARHAA
jgi:uncharacterized protein (DUF58 family)